MTGCIGSSIIERHTALTGLRTNGTGASCIAIATARTIATQATFGRVEPCLERVIFMPRSVRTAVVLATCSARTGSSSWTRRPVVMSS